MLHKSLIVAMGGDGDSEPYREEYHDVSYHGCEGGALVIVQEVRDACGNTTGKHDRLTIAPGKWLSANAEWPVEQRT